MSSFILKSRMTRDFPSYSPSDKLSYSVPQQSRLPALCLREKSDNNTFHISWNFSLDTATVVKTFFCHYIKNLLIHFFKHLLCCDVFTDPKPENTWRKNFWASIRPCLRAVCVFAQLKKKLVPNNSLSDLTVMEFCLY